MGVFYYVAGKSNKSYNGTKMRSWQWDDQGKVAGKLLKCKNPHFIFR